MHFCIERVKNRYALVRRSCLSAPKQWWVFRESRVESGPCMDGKRHEGCVPWGTVTSGRFGQRRIRGTNFSF